MNKLKLLFRTADQSDQELSNKQTKKGLMKCYKKEGNSGIRRAKNNAIFSFS